MVEHRLTYQWSATLGRFHRSDAEVRGVMGPIGGGKTSGCLMEFPLRATKQKPSEDGVRYSSWTALRDTYRNLERTTIPSWLEWFPKEAGEWRGGSSGEPASHHIRLPLADGTTVDMIVEFNAIGDASLEDFFRGLRKTGFYLNEADRLPLDAIHLARQRAGRYPSMHQGGPSWYGVWADFNAPNWGDPICDYFIENRPDGVAFFEQPGGLSPDAENRAHLPPEYYEKQMEGAEEWWIKRMIHNEIGHSRAGKPVYPEFGMRLHVAERPIEPMQSRPLILGLDAGRSPAAGYQQRDSEGQLRLLGELVCTDMGAQAFGQRLREDLAERWPGLEAIGICDPSAADPTETSNRDDDAWMDIVSNEAEIRIRPAPSQKAVDRREALRQPMMRMITHDKPGLIVSPTCRVTIRGLAHGFRYKAMLGGRGLFHDRPEKNEFSHIVEAHEYGALGSGDFADLRGRRRRRGEARGRTQVDWRPEAFR